MDKTRIFRIRPLQEADIPEMQDLFRSIRYYMLI